MLLHPAVEGGSRQWQLCTCVCACVCAYVRATDLMHYIGRCVGGKQPVDNKSRAHTHRKNAHKQSTVTNRCSCITLSAIPDESISTAFITLKCNSWIGNTFAAFLLLFINFFVYFLCNFIHRFKLSKAFLLRFVAVKAGLFSETIEWAWNQILMSNTILASHINKTKNIEGKKKVIIMPHVAPPDQMRERCVSALQRQRSRF